MNAPLQSDDALRAIVVHQAAMILDRDTALQRSMEGSRQLAQSIKALEDVVRRLQDKLGMKPGDPDYLDVGRAIEEQA